MKTGKVLLGILGGVAIGALLGVLLAPDKGSNTRKKIRRKGEDLVDDVKAKLDDVVEEAGHKIQEVLTTASVLAQKGREKANSIKNEVMGNS